MKNLWKALWVDESGMILSAEAALLGTVGIVGATVGLSAARHSVNEELKEMAFAFRSLDQSFSFQGEKSEFAWTAGSSYRQPDVAASREKLQEQIERQEKKADRHQEKRTPGDLENRKPELERPARRRHRRADVIPIEPEWRIDGATANAESPIHEKR